MKIQVSLLLFVISIFLGVSCFNKPENAEKKLSIIFDTDANNELDDQHALAYLLLSDKTFDIKGITVNATRNGGNIEGHYLEAERIMKLCEANGRIPLLKGANASFIDIKDNLTQSLFDGSEAVNFIIEEAKKYRDEKLIILAVGKLTNVALALEKDPSIGKKIRLVWLGSNYPDPGEYNLENDIPSMNFLLEKDVDFEMVMVRYGKESGTDAVRISKEQVFQNMPALGLRITSPIIGRHGGEFYNFGDYSMNLFSHIDYYGTPPSRALFDMAAVAILKQPGWAKATTVSAPIMSNEKWEEQVNNDRKIKIWEDFNSNEILNDFYSTLNESKSK